MANIWWYNDGSQPSANWDEVANWWSDSGHSTPDLSIPVTNDYVYLLGSNPPDAAASTPVTLGLFDSSGMAIGTAFVAAITTPLTIAGGAGGPGVLLTCGVASDLSSYHQWGGQATFGTGGNGTNALFQGGATNRSTTSYDTITFNDSASHVSDTITIGTLCAFNDSSDCNAPVVGACEFNDTSILDSGGAITGAVTVNGIATSSGTITGNVTMSSGVTWPGGTITGDVTFVMSGSLNGGTINGNVTFTDSTMTSGTIVPAASGSVQFLGTSAMAGGTITLASGKTVYFGNSGGGTHNTTLAGGTIAGTGGTVVFVANAGTSTCSYTVSGGTINLSGSSSVGFNKPGMGETTTMTAGTITAGTINFDVSMPTGFTVTGSVNFQSISMATADMTGGTINVGSGKTVTFQSGTFMNPSGGTGTIVTTGGGTVVFASGSAMYLGGGGITGGGTVTAAASTTLAGSIVAAVTVASAAVFSGCSINGAVTCGGSNGQSIYGTFFGTFTYSGVGGGLIVSRGTNGGIAQ